MVKTFTKPKSKKKNLLSIEDTSNGINMNYFHIRNYGIESKLLLDLVHTIWYQNQNQNHHWIWFVLFGIRIKINYQIL